MTDWLIAALAGAVTGVLSGFGVGGGSLLLIYMTSFAGVPQTLAQGVNLLYFLPTAATALPAHFKNGYVEKKPSFPPSPRALRAPPSPPGRPPRWMWRSCANASAAFSSSSVCGNCCEKDDFACLSAVFVLR